MTDTEPTQLRPKRTRKPRTRRASPRRSGAAPGGLIATMQKGLIEKMGTHTCSVCKQPHSDTSKASVAREIGVTTPTLDKFLRNGNASGPTMERIWAYLQPKQD